MSLWKVFERSVRLYENKTALIFGEERISYKQLYEKSCHIADHLYEIAGGKEQQKVFILSKNSIDMVALMLACMRRNLIELAAFSQGTGSDLKKPQLCDPHL